MRRQSANSLESKVALLLEDCPVGKPYLIGVSGGRDSVALLHILLRQGYSSLIVCHLDHALRPESGSDAGFVRDLAAKESLEIEIARDDVRARAKERRQSIETAAREVRYQFFADVAQRRDCPRIFLGHHADDQVETFLLNLFRGAGASGLAGMATRSHRSIGSVELRLVRPLLSTWRHEIDRYIAEHQLAFREDSSNAHYGHTRNRLRHQLIPAIEEAFGRDVRPAIWRTAALLRAEDDFLRAQIPVNLPAQLSVQDLKALPESLQRRTIHAWLKAHLVTNLGFQEVELVRKLYLTRCAKANLPGGIHVRRRGGKLFLDPPQPETRNAKRGTRKAPV